MIDRHELQGAISECLNNKNPNANTCIKLASFYTIMDHLETNHGKYTSDTDFGKLLGKVDEKRAWAIIDELMTKLQSVSPRLYDGVMEKMRQE